MKKKKLFVMTSALLSTVLFASCSGGVSTSFSANWYANTAINTVVEGTSETLAYSVAMKEDSNQNKVYSALYRDGVYTTSLSAETKEGELYYSYQTKLTVSVQYVFQSDTSESFTDTLATKVLFKNTKSGLRPLRSEKTVESHSPNPYNMAPSKLDECYKYYRYSVVIDYEKDGNNATSVYTNLLPDEQAESKHEFSISDKYSYVDNEELQFAIRGLTLTSAQQLQVYNPARKQVIPVKITPSAEESEEFSFVMNGAAVKKPIAYYPVSVGYSVENPGGTVTAWYAKTTDLTANTYRNVMLKMEMPLSFGLGTLVYTLTSANFAAT